MCRRNSRNGASSPARRSSSGIVTALRFWALGLRPSFQLPQPEKPMYLSNPRAAGFPSNPTDVVL